MQKSFLKWAGGKSSLLEYILPKLPKGNPRPNDIFGEQAEAYRLFDVFTGSAVIYRNTNYEYSIINDINTDLINVYKTVIDDAISFVADLRPLFEHNNKNDFYQFREEFNNTKDIYRKSLLFVYLNRHCFNGLCRYNKKGIFNVPYGDYDAVSFPENEILSFQKQAISTNLELMNTSFENVFARVEGKGDVVYVDPPYIPVSDTSSFTDYATEGFTTKQQEQVAELCKEAADKGAVVIASNNDVPLARELYKDAEIYTIRVNRFISGNKESRQKVNEILAVFK